MALALRAVSMPRCVTAHRPSSRTPVVVVRAGLWNAAGTMRVSTPYGNNEISRPGKLGKPCRAVSDENEAAKATKDAANAVGKAGRCAADRDVKYLVRV
ncbi:hypothetical protein FOA52_003251 [Chlamydomonas sp. UWO 241]|nr:hypothetical protein FOA52_003251 [Chlamydomonas sp. UWO 241]